MSVPMRWESCVAPLPEAPAPPLRRRKRAPRRWKVVRRLVALAGLITVSGMAAASVWNGLQGTSQPALVLAKSAPSRGVVAVGATTIERHLGYVTVTGSVTNRSSNPLSNVEAMVELLDADGNILRMESGLIAFDPLPAGESAPFRVVLPDDSRAVTVRVPMRQLLGMRLD